MKTKALLVIFLLNSILLFTQELPPIITYPPEEYQADNQNWMISQSSDKTIYIANNSGLLEFDGSRFKLYYSPNRSVIRSVKVINDLVYTGCFMEFGYWKKNDFGLLVYQSLIPKLKEPLIDDEQFWNILEVGDWVLFQSLDRIYSYNTIDQTFTVIDSETSRAKIFNIDNNVFFQQSDKGIFEIKNGNPILVSEDPILAKNLVMAIYRIDQKLLFLLEKGGFYYLEEDGLKKWNTEADKQLNEMNLFSSIQLSDGSFALGTISNGLYRIDKTGKTINAINKEKGLYNNTILSMFEDMDKNLWLGLDNGVSVINYDSQFKEYNDLKGEVGNVYAAKIFNGLLYIGTNQGLFYKEVNSQDSFQIIDGTQGQVWCLVELNGTLFCGHNKGTYVVKNNSASLICEFPGTWNIKKIEKDSSLLLQGNYEGLSVLEKRNGKWQLRNKLKGFDFSSRFFEFTDTNEIMVNNEYKGIFKLTVDPNLDAITNIQNEPANGFGSSLVLHDDTLLYTENSNQRILKYDHHQHNFVVDTVLSKMFYGPEDNLQGILIPDNETNKLWGFGDKNIIYTTPGKLSDSPEVVKIPIPLNFRRSLGITGFENISHLTDNTYLIGDSNGYTLLDLDKVKTKEYSIRITSAFKKSINAPRTDIPLNTEPEMAFKENNLEFSYSVPNYDKYAEVSYQYKLDGLNDNWSNWLSQPDISFENLSFGDYTFNVRAKIGDRLSKNIASFSFVIKRPWYYSNGAILCYFLFLALISFLIHKLYKAYYKKQHARLLKENTKKLKRKKLKAQRKIVEIKNEKLRQDITNKNRELAISTMSIIKKNEFLSAIRDQLKENADNPGIKSVIRTINQNINNGDDWSFFEEAFNNADKDFLKKIKKLHPELTPNDLKLCAYLRLNLSSKEIAPLLNISVRSVEVKRYRLRKKMQLQHESGLTDYILNL
ncbi:triple tyrosine motif-containing protein [Maribacter sp. TH_r10]|uniref:helix-turn-helix and ligand-binding sensor domain-containing protein n=1 Tax=Maribacter sp. TH_r10 TaxID=3082086 RepID=UPI0029546E36|nr:triple tyrosine motif-containing protein [Maribacter sp. TH_r10]MDV7140736.1 triple tyrosine motif-containing protein [Maribacter sp. TH_r10]